MIYNVYTRELRTDKGKLLKKLDCPLHKEWSQLKVLDEDDTSRHCNSCQKCVVNLQGKSEAEVEALLAASPDCCVYIAPATRSVKIEGYGPEETDDPCPFRRIQTARGKKAINQGVKDGFWPLVKKVERSSKMKSWMEVYQHEETGEIETVGDVRWHPDAPWKRIIRPFTFYPHPFEHEIAAYLLPADLKIGERVFLTDLIEDLVGVYGNQSHTTRLDSAYAIWNGKDFRIQWAAWKDAPRLIG